MRNKSGATSIIGLIGVDAHEYIAEAFFWVGGLLNNRIEYPYLTIFLSCSVF